MHFWLRLWVWVIPGARDFTDSGDFIGSADLGTLIFFAGRSGRKPIMAATGEVKASDIHDLRDPRGFQRHVVLRIASRMMSTTTDGAVTIGA
jgi:hypothetical protein